MLLINSVSSLKLHQTSYRGFEGYIPRRFRYDNLLDSAFNDIKRSKTRSLDLPQSSAVDKNLDLETSSFLSSNKSDTLSKYDVVYRDTEEVSNNSLDKYVDTLILKTLFKASYHNSSSFSTSPSSSLGEPHLNERPIQDKKQQRLLDIHAKFRETISEMRKSGVIENGSEKEIRELIKRTLEPVCDRDTVETELEKAMKALEVEDENAVLLNCV